MNVKRTLLQGWEYLRHEPRKIVLFGVLLVSLYMMLFGDFGILKRLQMEAEYRQLLQEEQRTQAVLHDNALRIKNARNPDSIEKAAREKYNFRKPGETLFLIVSPSE